MNEGVLVADTRRLPVPRHPGHLLQRDLLSRCGLVPCGGVRRVIENDMDKIHGPGPPDRGHAAQVHEEVAIPVEDHYSPLGPAQG